MRINRTELLKYLSDTSTRLGTYHNHKEATAWAMVAFFYLFAVQITFAVAGRREAIGRDGRMAVGIVLGVVALFLFFAVREQYRLRIDAANAFAACHRLSASCFRSSDDELANLDFDLPELSRAAATHHQVFLPKFIRDEAAAMTPVGQKPIRNLRAISYGLLTVAAVAAIATVILS